MNKYFNAGLVFLYVLLTILCFMLVLVLSGVPIPDRTGWLIVAGWVLFCFSSWYFITGAGLFYSGSLRKPLLAEEERLGSAFREVSERAGYTKPIKLRIHETSEWNAYACGPDTIAVSKGFLATLTEEELKGVLAHELGHLSSLDTLIATAYATAGYLPYIVGRIFRIGAVIIRAGFMKDHKVGTKTGRVTMSRFSMLSGVVVLLLFWGLLHFLHLSQAVLPVVLFVVLFGILNRIFHFFTLLLGRLAEYRQDVFAQRLGYGKGLRQALEKLAGEGEQVVNPYYILFHSTHPMLYNRIHRLEKLDGLRR